MFNKSRKKEIPLSFYAKYYTIGIILGSMQQFTGVNSILYYSTSIFSKYELMNPLLGTILFIGLWNWLTVFIAIFISDKFPRRPIMFASFIGIIIGDILIGTSFFINNGILSIIGMMVFILFFQGGTGPLFWVIAPEMFPDSMRGPGLTMSILANWISNIFITFIFPILEQAIGGGPCFMIWAGISILSLIFLFFFLPESSGKLKNIEELNN